MDGAGLSGPNAQLVPVGNSKTACGPVDQCAGQKTPNLVMRATVTLLLANPSPPRTRNRRQGSLTIRWPG